MTWTASAVGAPPFAIEQAEGWLAQVALTDRARAVSAVTHALHQRQVERCVHAVKEFAGALPAGYHLTASANGAVHLAGSPEEWGITLRAYKPVPNVRARVIDDTPDTLGNPLK